jgi:hypothetical protein
MPSQLDMINEVYRIYHLTNSCNKNSPNAMYINYISNIINFKNNDITSTKRSSSATPKSVLNVDALGSYSSSSYSS